MPSIQNMQRVFIIDFKLANYFTQTPTCDLEQNCFSFSKDSL